MDDKSGITIITPKTLPEASDLAKLLSGALMVPEALRGKPGDVLAVILTGAELGLAPMQSLRAIDVIKGKPALKAETMVALVRGRRDVCEYLRIVESNDKVATYEGKRHGDPAPTRISFSIDDAQRAGLMSNGTWRAYPAAMLRARAGSAICKAMFSDLTLGLYDPDELATPTAPQDARVERDVTPAPAPSSAAAALKAKAVAAVQQTFPGAVEDAVLAPPTPPPAPMPQPAPSPAKPARIVDADTGAPLPRKSPTPCDVLLDEAKARGQTWEQATGWLKANCGARDKRSITLDMVAEYVAAHPVGGQP